MAHNPFQALKANNPAIAAIADAVTLEDDGRRADANETSIISNALVAAGIEAVMYDYPDLKFRELAPLQPGIGAGAVSFTWQEYDITGSAKIFANKADDLPDVQQYAKTNTGDIRGMGNSYSYTTRDARRVLQAKRSGQQSNVLDADRIAVAREIQERTKDTIAAVGDTANNLPGLLKGANVTVLTGASPATGSSKKWDGGDKTGGENLKDLRTGCRTMAVNSKGKHLCNTIVMSIEFAEYLAVQPLVPNTENQITVLDQFLASQRAKGQPIKIVAWNQCHTADAANTGDRVLFLKSDPSVLGLVEPFPFTARSPQMVGLDIVVPCESEFGGVYYKRPLGAVAMDFV